MTCILELRSPYCSLITAAISPARNTGDLLSGVRPGRRGAGRSLSLTIETTFRNVVCIFRKLKNIHTNNNVYMLVCDHLKY